MKKNMDKVKKTWENIRTKKHLKTGLAGLGILLLSTGAFADDDHDRDHHNEGSKAIRHYEEALESQYSNLEINSKNYELEFDLKDLDTFLLMEVEVESNFFSKSPTNEEIKKAIEPVLEAVNKDIQTDLKKPLRVVVEYDDVNILNKRFEK